MTDWQGASGQANSTDLWTRPPHSAEPRRGRSLVRDLIETVLLTLVIFIAVRAMVLNYRVEGLSMAPSLQNGQYLLVNRAIYASLDADSVHDIWPDAPAIGERFYLFQAPQRGDIVVLWPPSSSDRPYIKRIIGLPGETVAIRDGTVTVNGVALDEEYIRTPPAYVMAPRKIGPNEYFVLGDNRNNSSDSHLFGTVPADHIVGKAWLTYWPAALVGPVPTVSYAAPVNTAASTPTPQPQR